MRYVDFNFNSREIHLKKTFDIQSKSIKNLCPKWRIKVKTKWEKNIKNFEIKVFRNVYTTK